MSKTYRLGKIAGLMVSARPSALFGFVLLWLILSGAAFVFLELSWSSALIAGFVAAVLHYGSEFWHQIGHAAAARSTGYPMIGTRFHGFLAVSLYQRDEIQLPADIHIRRALGGPRANFILSLVAGVLVWIFYPADDVVWWILVFVFIENLFIFTLGAFLPLGFTDGSTILHWRRKRNERDEE